MRRLLFASTLLVPVAAFGQPVQPPGIPRSMINQPNGVAGLDGSASLGGQSVLGRSLSNQRQDIVNVMDAPYGAVCNGVADDATPINAAFAAIRSGASAHGSAEIQATLRIPRQCVVKSPINATNISSRGLIIDMSGGQLVGQITPAKFTGSITGGVLTVTAVTSGTLQVGDYLTGATAQPLATITALGTGTGGVGTYTVNSTTTIASEAMVGAMPILDATGTRFLKWVHGNISGDCTQTASVGFVHGVYRTTAVADENTFDRLSVQGCYTLAAYVNNASESNVYSQLLLRNSYAAGLVGACFTQVMDGLNHFGWSSAFQPMTLARDTAYTFTENRIIGGDVRNFGNCTPGWIGGSTDSQFKYYIANAGAGSGIGVVLYTTGGASNTKLEFDLHVETAADLATTYQFQGDATQKFSDVKWDDELPEPTTAYMGVGAGVTAVTLVDAQIHVPTFLSGTAHLFDPASVSVFQINAGHIATNTTAAMNLPANQIIGDTWNGSTLTRSGIGTVSSVSGGLALTAQGALSYSLPSPLSVSQIVTTGGVTGVTASPRGDYVSTGTGGGTAIPTIALSAPTGGGGTQALAHISAVSATGTGTIVSGGTGYAVNDLFHLVGGGCSTAPQQKVTAVSAGVVTAYTGNSTGAGCTSLIAAPISTVADTGAGSGLTTTAQGFGISAITVDAAGSGYLSAPTVTLTPGTGTTTVASPTFAVALNSAFSAQGGGLGQLVLDQTGAKLGTAGVGGSPAYLLGASIDGSVVRTTLTGAAYTVPSNTSLVRLVQTGTVAAQTITLPTALADAQVLQFSNYGPITALTFSPSVLGWTNASALAANIGLRVRWDATTSTWQREE